MQSSWIRWGRASTRDREDERSRNGILEASLPVARKAELKKEGGSSPLKPTSSVGTTAVARIVRQMSSDRDPPIREEDGFANPRGDAAVGMARDGTAAQLRQRRQHQRGGGGGGAQGVPGRILSTLQRKFWDSNKVLYGLCGCGSAPKTARFRGISHLYCCRR